ncbi:MAG: DUF262 domain-containing protein, partial [Candidatus Nealsonbacteria bacterium]|nr:DUF262 domain-containing protein [Candidatus Nealsonbacteria bacterium]
MASFIQSGHERIGELLARQRKYRVPQHQRDYSWSDDQVSQFWEDVLSAMPSGMEHFLGAIVFRQIEEDQDYEVIDGQQRLATCLLLLAAIRDVYRENNDEMADQVQLEYSGRKDRRSRTIVPNFLMNDTNDEVFQKYIANSVARRSIESAKKERTTRLTNRRLLEAYLFFREKLEDATSVQGKFEPHLLADIEEFLSKKLTIILVTVSDEADAFTLFETLNERGLELSVMDLLKNLLFGKAKDRIEAVKRNWTEMTANLDDAVGVRFLRHYWVSEHGRVQAGKLFRDIRGKTQSKTSATALSTELCRTSMVYSALSTADHPFWEDYSPKLRDHIRTLNVLNAVQCYPVLWPVRKKMSHLLVEQFGHAAPEEQTLHELWTLCHGLQLSSR